MAAIGLGNPQQAPRTGQLPDETERLHAELQKLSNAIDSLHARLNPVVRNEPPSNPATGPEVREVLVPAADAIRGAIITVRLLAASVESITGRLEV